MLKINMEFRKGILFVRLKGILNKNTYKSLLKYFLPLIIDDGIKNIVFNFDRLSSIDKYGKEALEEIEYWTNSNNGKYLISNCNFKLDDKFITIDNEIDAFKIIEI